MARLFISQAQLDRWTEAGRIELDGDVMTLPALGRAFRLQPAVQVVASVEGGDQAQLVGRVKTRDQVEKLGAEQSGPSLLLGDAAYECIEGFLGVPTDTVQQTIGTRR